jgi:lipoate---protein ligase
MRPVTVELRRGGVAELHDTDPFAEGGPDAPSVWLCDPTSPAVAIGSRQSPELFDAAACEVRGVVVVRRRSGGGAVLVVPGEVVWIDLVVPSGLSPDDVRASMVWAGAVWEDALRTLGASGRGLARHTGGMVDTAWSALVCFAGVGPGEIVVAGRKLVGLSQRRTRRGVRVQGLVHRRPIVADLRELIAGAAPDADLPEPAVLGDIGLGAVTDRELAAAVAVALASRTTPV